MERLPDTNYTEQALNGIAPQSGIKRPGPTFNQGEDVLISFYLMYEGHPVTGDDWKLEAIVKKSVAAKNVLWRGLPKLGLYEREVPGYYNILMPAAVSSLFLPGTYYLDIKGVQKFGKGDEVKELTRHLLSGTFNLRLTAASPNPTLKPTMVSEVIVDPETGSLGIQTNTVEPTLPEDTDISSP